MFSVRRTVARHVLRPLSRPFAELAIVDPAASQAPVHSERQTRSQRKKNRPKDGEKYSNRVPVAHNHGLYAFFRRKPDEKLVGEDRFEVFETPESAQLISGRAWKAAELRNKSFKDLHTLWYVALREKNLLATQKEEVRRMGVTNTDLQVPMERVRQCRKTMARIKAVLNERRLAYEGAVKLVEKERETLNAKEAFDLENAKVSEFLQQIHQDGASDHPSNREGMPSEVNRSTQSSLEHEPQSSQAAS